LILPTHRLLDVAYEKAKGDSKIGSTLKGIGPTYQDKIGRQGLRVGDILSSNFHAKFKKLTEIHFKILKDHDADYKWSELEATFFDAVNFLKEFNLIESEYFINQELKLGSSILASRNC
jgi:adenylosuccinate synthase